jgi:hypothetical protein
METIRNTYLYAMKTIEKELNSYVSIIENELQSEFIYLDSDINDSSIEETLFERHLRWAENNKKHDNLVIMICSYGGDPETVFRMVNRIRANFNEVRFIINHQALSAASLLCLSGDEIYMGMWDKMGDLRLQISYGKYHYPFSSYLENEYVQIEKDIRLSEKDKGFISMLKHRLSLKSNKKFQEDIKNAALSYLKKYMFKEYDSLSDYDKNIINQIPEKLTDWKYLTNSNCITHDSGLYYKRLKHDIGLKIIYKHELNNKLLRGAIVDFSYLITDYKNINNNNSCCYSRHINDILSNN